MLICLTTLVPLLLCTLFAEPLTAWLHRIACRLHLVAYRLERCAEEQSDEPPMSWPQTIRFILDEWRKTG